MVLDAVRRIRQYLPRVGGRKLHRMLAEVAPLKGWNFHVGRDWLFELLRDHRLLLPRRRSRQRTTDSNHGWPVYPNRLAEQTPDGPHQAWAADITYIRCQEGFAYLALVTDVYSRQIVGWDLSRSLELEGACRALQRAYKQAPEQARPLHHSDRGSQYASRAYRTQLKTHKSTISMTEEDHCYENALAERVNGILKQEFYMDQCFADVEQARKACREAIWSYNYLRPHMSLDYQTPAQYHEERGAQSTPEYVKLF